MSSTMIFTSFRLDLTTFTEPYPNLKVTHTDKGREREIDPNGEEVSIRWTKQSALYVSVLDLSVIRLEGRELLSRFVQANSENCGLLGHDWSKNRICQITLSRNRDGKSYEFNTTFKIEQITWREIASRVWS